PLVPSPLVKSMSETGCMSTRRRAITETTSPTIDETPAAFQLDDEEGEVAAGQRLEKPTFQLDLDESQATVGHERGEWVKDLLKEGKKASNASGGSEQPPVSDSSSNNSGSNSRVGSKAMALASMFIRDQKCDILRDEIAKEENGERETAGGD